MTLSEFSTWLTDIDPAASRYEQPQSGNCTIWREYQNSPVYADQVRTADLWKVQIERYTTDENDAIAAAIEQAIDESIYIAASHLVDNDPAEGVIRHVFDCEVLG